MLLSRTFRTQPDYEIVVADRLRPEELRAAEGPAGESDFYGILRPRTGARPRPLKAIDAPTALLLLTLRDPGPLPAFARRALGTEAEATLARLVADGILEVERDGAFLSGAQALADGADEGASPAATALARLSLAALHSAAHLETREVERIAFHLYAAGRLPAPRAAPSRREGEGGSPAPLVGDGPEEGRRFAARWQPSHRTDRWWHWRSGRQDVRIPAPHEAVYKLYISPLSADLPRLGGALTVALHEGGAFELKLGAGAGGLLRPDKLVAYFADRPRLAEVADLLVLRLCDLGAVRPHGVPFTAELAGDGLLSWGLDPADDPAAGGWRRAAGAGWSWRHWLVLHLAGSLCAARRDGVTPEVAVRFALERARLAGIDPAVWAPDEALRRAWEGVR